MADNINDGGAAFPIPLQHQGGCEGMSLRDWFAGQALAGMMAHPEADYSPLGNTRIKNTALDAYAVADAMLEARERPTYV